MKHKILTLLFAIIASVGTMFSQSGTCGDNLTWNLTNGVLIISGTGDMTDHSSSTSVPWYSYRSSIQHVVIGNGVTSIGDYAFYYCQSMTSVTISNSVTSIGRCAFDYCSALQSVSIPNSVTSIGYLAFSSCSGLTSVTIPNSVTSIGQGAFSYCIGLTSINVESGNTNYSSKDGVLFDKRKTELVQYPAGKNTSTYDIPNSVTSIWSAAFSGCRVLTSVSIPNSITSIGYYAFSGCTSLSSVTNYAVIPQTIDASVFADMNISACSLQVHEARLAAYRTATVWKDFGTIQAISGDTPCTPISGTCGGNLTWKLSCDSVLTISGAGAMADFNSASDIPWYEYRDAIKSIVISKGVTNIAGNAFQKCTNLTSVTIPTSVTSIGQVAFYECTALTSVKIPGSVTSIGMGAFTYCSGLTSLTIPNSVRTIGQGAFGYCTSLRSVTIGSGITSIEQGVFGNCSSLTSVTIPSNVTSIGQVAFFECTSLTSVSIPNSVTSIGQGAFGYCSSLTSVTIPSCLTTIELETFEYCSSLTSIVIPDGITSIGEWAFQSCTSLTSVTIPSSVTSISDEVFSGCTGLRSVTNYATTPQTIDAYVFDNVNISACTLYVPAGSLAAYRTADVWKNFGTIQAIGGSTPCLIASGTCGENLTWELTCDSVLTISGTGAMPDFNSTSDNPWYEHRNAIKSVIIDNGVTSIGRSAFSGCSGLTSVTIPNSVTSIGERAFQSCSGLTSVTIGNSVTSIGNYAFDGCTGLTSVTIPNSVTSIGDCAFYGCSGLTSVTIPNSVTNIGTSAFAYCKGLTSVTIPNSVTSIGRGAFNGCSGLTSIYVANDNPNYYSVEGVLFNKYMTTLVQCPGGKQGAYIIPNSVTSIGSRAFYNCKGLTSVTIPNSVTSIGQSAFGYCTGLHSVTIGSGVTSIGNFAFYNCSSLTSVTNYAITPQTIDYLVFEEVDISSSTLYVPADSYAAYLIANVWGGFGTIIAIEGDIPCPIASGICGDRITWELSCDSVLTISGTGVMADFDDTNNNPWYAYWRVIKSVVINNGVTDIGNYAFDGCSRLSSVTIPNSVTNIGNYAFDGCGRLSSVTIPNSVTRIGNSAFRNCYGLESVTIPNSVSNIGNNAFYECHSLNSVTNYATTPQTINANVFSHSNIYSCTLYVPAESVEAYKAADVWKEFLEITTIGAEGIEDAQSDQVQSTKILRNGQIFIQRGEKIYTITGQEIQSY